MKREIKFRAWNGLSMDYSDCLHCFFDIYSDDDSMQYIGINDKNGKEIYEGDILLHIPHRMTDHNKNIVEYTKYGFFYPFGNSDFALEGKEAEVVGNIFENPELA